MRAVVCDEVGAELRLVENHPEPVADLGGTTFSVTACGVCLSLIHI